MRAVKRINYLFLRKQTYYFRFNFLSKNLNSDIRLSLNTKNLVYALKYIEKLAPLINELKQLAKLSDHFGDPVLNERIDGIKEKMRKKLALADIDLILAQAESNTSNHFHMMDVLSDVVMQDLPDQTLKQLADVMLTEDVEARRQKVASYSQQNESFQQGLSLLAKSVVIQQSGIELEEQIANNSADQGVGQIARLLQAYDAADNHTSEPTQAFVDKDAESLLKSMDYDYQTDSVAFKVLSKKLNGSRDLKTQLAKAVIDGDIVKERELETLLKRHTPSIPAQPGRVEAKHETPILSEVYAEFLAFKIEKENLTVKMQKDYQRYWTVWQALAVDKPVAEYTPKDIGIFIDRCFELPKMNKAPYNQMSWNERLNCDVQEEDLATPKTVQQYYKLLQGVFAYAKKDTVGYINVSPCTIKRDFKQRKRGIYSDTEVRQLASFAKAQQEPWKKWCLLLGVFTGARRSEIFQLRKSDVRRDSDSGLHYLLITDEHQSQKLKTENARRRIPVHSQLIEYGFLTYVDECNERILEDISSPEAITRWFAKVVEDLGISTTNEVGDMRSYHSFRHTFITKIRTEGQFDLALLQQIVGHEISKAGITDRYTHSHASIARMAEVVETLKI